MDNSEKKFTHITWTDFGQGGRVHVLSRHYTAEAGVNCVRRFSNADGGCSGYPHLKLVKYPEGWPADHLDGDVTGKLAEIIRNSEVIFAKKPKNKKK